MYRTLGLVTVMAAVLCVGAGCDADLDGDGVPDVRDECQGTPAGDTVYANGCTVPTDGVPSRCQGRDPACMAIEYSLLSQTSETEGTVLVKGVVQNIGTEDYLSDPNQQSVQLWADGVMVAITPFEDLVVDQTVTVEEERSWDTQSEFPPVLRYQLIVTYDPDILLDDNVANDDCRFNNNSILRSTVDIEELFE